MPVCVYCAKPLTDEKICSSCGGEQPVAWMVNIVYVLVFLFIQGTLYRLLFPNADSLVKYGVFFVATTAATILGWAAWKRFRSGRAALLNEESEKSEPTD